MCGFIDALLDELPRRFPVDPTRIYVTGFSNGAGMAFRLGAELSERFAALAPVAGHCWVAQPRPVVPLPTLYLVGAQDPLIPLEGGEVLSPWSNLPTYKPPVRETLEKWANALGCAVQEVTRSEQNGVQRLHYESATGVELTAYLIAGLGHHWPGGGGQLSRRLAGTPSARVQANDLIADFFHLSGTEH